MSVTKPTHCGTSVPGSCYSPHNPPYVCVCVRECLSVDWYIIWIPSVHRIRGSALSCFIQKAFADRSLTPLASPLWRIWFRTTAPFACGNTHRAEAGSSTGSSGNRSPATDKPAPPLVSREIRPGVGTLCSHGWGRLPLQRECVGEHNLHHLWPSRPQLWPRSLRRHQGGAQGFSGVAWWVFTYMKNLPQKDQTSSTSDKGQSIELGQGFSMSKISRLLKGHGWYAFRKSATKRLVCLW